VPSRFDTMPSQPSAQACLKMIVPSSRKRDHPRRSLPTDRIFGTKEGRPAQLS
jgi:hypothetical protein